MFENDPAARELIETEYIEIDGTRLPPLSYDDACAIEYTHKAIKGSGIPKTVLDYLDVGGDPWFMFLMAAERGNVDLLKYLYAKGCRDNDEMAAFESGGEHADVRQWLLETMYDIYAQVPKTRYDEMIQLYA